MNKIITQTAQILEKGGLILYPTDTVWGLGCDACNTKAVQKIFKLKCRCDEQSMLVLADDSMLAMYLVEFSEVARNLTAASDKPLTIIYPRTTGLAHGVAANDGTVGIRIPQHKFCVDLLRQFKRPLVSTSANISGTPTPRSFDEITPEIINGVDFVVPRFCEGKMTGKPSSIIKLYPDGELKTIRE